MTCVTHPERESTAFCRACGKAMCAECKRDVRGVIYCETCLARDLSAAAHPSGGTFASSGPNPGVALGLGFIPGVGAIYNGQYAKAFVHVILFGVLISIVDNPSTRGYEPLFGLMIPAFIAYMAFEAFHTAKKRLAGQTVDEWSGLASGDSAGGRSGGAIFLIVLGILFLLNNLGYLSLSTVLKFWPLGLIGLGLTMLVQRMGGPNSSPPPRG